MDRTRIQLTKPAQTLLEGARDLLQDAAHSLEICHDDIGEGAPYLCVLFAIKDTNAALAKVADALGGLRRANAKGSGYWTIREGGA